MKNTKIAFCAITVVFLMIVFFASCSKGPSESQVIKDWEAVVQKHKECKNFVRLKKAEIVGTSLDGNIAEVIVRITGDWIGGHSEGYTYASWEALCYHFNSKAGENQEVEWKFVYKKYDSGWRLESNGWLDRRLE